VRGSWASIALPTLMRFDQFECEGDRGGAAAPQLDEASPWPRPRRLQRLAAYSLCWISCSPLPVGRQGVGFDMEGPAQ
jgi:hypothetical protein